MPAVALRWVLIRDPAERFKTQALLCTNPQTAAADIVHGFVRRWQLEVTFEEVRAHLGVETQRQWSKSAIARTSPVLLGLVFSRDAHRAATGDPSGHAGSVQRLVSLQIGGLPWGQKEAGRVPQHIGRRMHFGAQSAFTAADGFVLALFFWAPALC